MMIGKQLPHIINTLISEGKNMYLLPDLHIHSSGDAVTERFLGNGNLYK